VQLGSYLGALQQLLGLSLEQLATATDSTKAAVSAVASVLALMLLMAAAKQHQVMGPKSAAAVVLVM
jgi:hypothetical protein